MSFTLGTCKVMRREPSVYNLMHVLAEYRPNVAVPLGNRRINVKPRSPQFKPEQKNTAEKNTCGLLREDCASWWKILNIYEGTEAYESYRTAGQR